MTELFTSIFATHHPTWADIHTHEYNAYWV